MVGGERWVLCFVSSSSCRSRRLWCLGLLGVPWPRGVGLQVVGCYCAAGWSWVCWWVCCVWTVLAVWLPGSRGPVAMVASGAVSVVGVGALTRWICMGGACGLPVAVRIACWISHGAHCLLDIFWERVLASVGCVHGCVRLGFVEEVGCSVSARGRRRAGGWGCPVWLEVP